MKEEANMNFESLYAIIDFAIEKEIESVEFYQNLSKEVKSSGESQMLAEFAEQEQKHRNLLETFRAKGITKSMEEYKLKWITDLKRSDYVEDLEYRKGMPYKDLLILAMKREEKALALYNQFLGQAHTEEYKKLFKVLCQEEAQHKLALETIYDDYIEEMGD
jgi:rubrerythrin